SCFPRRASGADVAADEHRRQRQLGCGQPERLTRQLLVHAVHLVEHLARLDHGDVELRIALAVAHADLGRLLRNRLVGEDADPDPATALDVARHGATGRLDLARREAAATGGLQSELAEGYGCAARGEPLVTALLILAVLASGRLQHVVLPCWFPAAPSG